VADVSFGKMNQFIEIVTALPTKDAEGFAISAGGPGGSDTVLANVQAYFEPKNSTEKWQNNAVFAEASALFRFRAIPGLKIETSYIIICGGERYDIISAEDIKGRGMYVEVIAKAQKPSAGVNGSG
jgi:head-tail adaptor